MVSYLLFITNHFIRILTTIVTLLDAYPDHTPPAQHFFPRNRIYRELPPVTPEIIERLWGSAGCDDAMSHCMVEDDDG